jgi:uncharacterized protein
MWSLQMKAWLQSIGLIPRSPEAKQPAAPPTAETAGLANRRLGLMATCWGRLFDVLNPNPNEVTIFEIAHHLSQINRFNGAGKFPYSVAQHSVLCAQECLRRYPACFELALACLLHDAAEAYLGDIIRPVKGLVAREFCPLEAAVQNAIWRHFEIEVDPEMQQIIHECDNAVVRTEAAALMIGSDKWNWGNVVPAVVEIEEISYWVAKERFLAEFSRLMEAAEKYRPTVPFRLVRKARLAGPAVAV